MRTGVIAKKVGMTRRLHGRRPHVPVTVLELENCQVVAQQDGEKDGYTAVQLGAGTAKVKRSTKAERGHFAKAKVEPKRKLAEFRVAPDMTMPVGAEMTADHFVAGQLVDVTGTTQGKGFAGGMKRWNFGGLRATHGVSVSPPFASVRPVTARIRARCSRARRWPATWATSSVTSRTSRSSRPTSSAA